MYHSSYVQHDDAYPCDRRGHPCIIESSTVVLTICMLLLHAPHALAQEDLDPLTLLHAAYPIVAEGQTYILEGNVNGLLQKTSDSELFETPFPAQVFDGASATIYAFCNYSALVKLMHDDVYVPYITDVMEDGKQYGMLTIIIAAYANTSMLPYNELTIATPALPREQRVVKGCQLGNPGCFLWEAFTHPETFKFYAMKLWLDEEIPVAVGQQVLGINKSLADTLDVAIDETDETKKVWTMYLKDQTTNITMTMTAIDLSPTPISEYIQFGSGFIDAMLAAMPDFGKEGEPTGIFNAIAIMLGFLQTPIFKTEFVQPVGVYPLNFGTTKNPTVESAFFAADGTLAALNGLKTASCELTMDIRGEWGALDAIPAGCLFVYNSGGLLLAPANDPAFVDNIAKRIVNKSN